MAEFTKGPWINTGLFIEDAKGDVIAAGVDTRNATLIAAAPTMFEAMAEFVHRCEIGEVRSIKTYAKFKEILAAADGKQDSDDRAHL